MTTLIIKLKALGWSHDTIREVIIDTYHECMEAFYRCEDGNFNSVIETILENNFDGIKCNSQQLFEAYDHLLEELYPSESYYSEREKNDNYERY